jgi:hypothetical protein
MSTVAEELQADTTELSDDGRGLSPAVEVNNAKRAQSLGSAFVAAPRGASGRYGGPVSCFTCNEQGHMARDCPKKPACYACHRPGHFASECPDKEARKRNDEYLRGSFRSSTRYDPREDEVRRGAQLGRRNGRPSGRGRRKNVTVEDAESGGEARKMAIRKDGTDDEHSAIGGDSREVNGVWRHLEEAKNDEDKEQAHLFVATVRPAQAATRAARARQHAQGVSTVDAEAAMEDMRILFCGVGNGGQSDEPAAEEGAPVTRVNQAAESGPCDGPWSRALGMEITEDDELENGIEALRRETRMERKEAKQWRAAQAAARRASCGMMAAGDSCLARPQSELSETGYSGALDRQPCDARAAQAAATFQAGVRTRGEWLGTA